MSDSMHAKQTAGWGTCSAIVVIAVTLALAIQSAAPVHSDVAYLTWVADRVLRGSVFGRDVYEINPPLNFMIYVPAALLGRVVGFDLAVKLWTAAVAALSLVCVWQTAEERVRLLVVGTLALCFALLMPGEYGQREQFALLLCAPYVAGNTPRRGLAGLNGVMAGIGFALKPYFLVPLLLVFAARRRIRREEVAIAATGVVYAAVTLLFFQPWLTELLSRQMTVYWTDDTPLSALAWTVGIVPAMLLPMWLVAAPQRGTSGYGLAALGFAIAVLLHRKGFPYHYIPALGFLALFLAALLANERRIARMLAIFWLVLLAGAFALFDYVSVLLMQGRNVAVRTLLPEVNAATSFLFLSNANFGPFPTAILTRTPFLGLAPSNVFATAAVRAELGLSPADGGRAHDLAIAQALTELGRKPDLVIVLNNWAPVAGLTQPFDGLAWFARDPQFQLLWKDYELSGSDKNYRYYRRK